MLLWAVARKLIIPGILIVTVAVALARSASFQLLFSPPARAVDTRAAIQFLQREDLSFLVTERVVTQVVVEKHESNVVLGRKEGYLVGTVELLYGVDLATLAPESFEARGERLHVCVPPPALLRSVIDESSLRFVQKRSPLFVIADNVRNDSLFRRSLEDIGVTARQFAQSNELAPSRGELVTRLNGYAPVIAAHTGVEVVFE